MIFYRFIWALVLAIFSLSAEAADIAADKKAIHFNGVIQSGDAKLLKKMLDKNEISVINLNSPGGDVSESILIANLIERYRITTQVLSGGNCISACFFIFIAGNGRNAVGIDLSGYTGLPLGFVGVHRPYMYKPDGRIPTKSYQTEIMRKVMGYLDYQMVPRRLTDIMMSRPSNDVYWLTSVDIEQLGAYPPALEELYISRCGYDRNLYTQAFSTTTPDGSLTDAQKLAVQKNSEVQECIKSLSKERFN